MDSNTLTTINWRRTKPNDTFTTWSGTRSGWDFTIDAPKIGRATLTAYGPGDRGCVTRHDTVRLAKEAAMAVMRPSEAMGWRSGTFFGLKGHEARWENVRFVAGLTDTGEYRSVVQVNGGKFEQLAPVGHMDDVRRAARRVLDERYPDVPVLVNTADDTPAEKLSRSLAALKVGADPAAIHAALKAAGLRLTVGAQV